jgi:hypothetical protein
VNIVSRYAAPQRNSPPDDPATRFTMRTTRVQSHAT